MSLYRSQYGANPPNENGVLVTESKIVFSRRVKPNVYGELTFFVAHISSVKLTVETVLPNYLGTFLIFVGALVALASLVAISNSSATGASGALVIGITLLVIGVLVNRAKRRRDNHAVTM